MEKFAIDLDKVLDDFEFNEDCAEQISTINPSPNDASSSTTQCSIESSTLKPYNYHVIEPGKSNKEFDITPPLEKHKDSQQVNTENRCVHEKEKTIDNLNYGRKESAIENLDSMNHFYIHDCANDNKLTQKQPIPSYDSEQVPLTIYNDVSQKLQKQQNGSNNPKCDNRYDKKLNQPNIKPSVSNVFNSLNEYINAPPGSLDCIHAVLDEQDTKPNIESTSTSDKNELSAKNIVVTNSNLMKNITKDTNINITRETTSNVIDVAMDSSVSNYEDTKVPTTVESFIVYKNDTESNNASGVTTVNTEVESEEEFPKYITRTAINENDVKYVYEDVHKDTNILGSQIIVEESSIERKTEHTAQNLEHSHENVHGSRQEKLVPLENDGSIYSCTDIETKQDEKVNEVQTSTTQKLVMEVCPTENYLKVNDQVSNVNEEFADDSICLHKPVGFSSIDDLSEEELTKYLAELEEEEKLKEQYSMCQNTSKNLPEIVSENVIQSTSQDLESKNMHDAPRFENAIVGEFSKLSQAKLQDQTKNIPIHDYSDSKKNENVENTLLDRQSLDECCDRVTNVTEEECKLEEEKCENTDKTENENLCNIQNVRPELPVSTGNDSTEHVESSTSEKRNVTDVRDVQGVGEHCMYNLNIDQAILSNTRTEELLKRTEEGIVNATSYEQSYDVKSQFDSNCNYEESKIDADAKCTSDTLSKSLETPANSNLLESNNESEKPMRPQTLDIVLTNDTDEHQSHGSASNTPSSQVQAEIDAMKDDCQGSSPDALENSLETNSLLGKQPPFWVPDSDAPSCMLCDLKFTVLKRRHHCRACGKVLCSKCCSMKYKLEYQGNIDSRVCVPCYQLLTKAENDQSMGDWSTGYSTYVGNNDINSPQGRQPNPNNPMEYCSTIPPLQQLAGGLPPPPTVMVPVGVLKREGGTKSRPEGSKSVMFSDGIRPGCDLTELDMSWDLKPPYRKPSNKRIPTPGSSLPSTAAKRQNLPRLDPNTESYVPQDPNALPPTVTIHKGQVSYHAVMDEGVLYKTLKNECEPPIMFAINRNLYAYVKITYLNCCVNKVCWNVTSSGLACVGQDEVILLVETLPDETRIPKDLLIFINQLYLEAIKGNTVSELGFSIYQGGNLLSSREHAGFLFIRQTLQCLHKITLPPAPFLVGLLVHRWETPWAKVFPLRLLLRLGAEYRYYPCPLVSVRFRDALYFEIGHTVMKVLADFRNFGYTLPGVRGLTIHLRNRMTDVMFPRNRYDQVIKGLNNSNDHVLAYASNFSISADSHLVCIQTNTGDESSYQTQAINIHNKPRTVTGASFIVINGALKSSMGLSAKSSIVEDGLMVEIMPEKMEALKAALKNMQDFSIGCGRQGAPEPDETVNIKWVNNDVQFNLGVKSPIDGQSMDGVPSIRVHNGTDYRGINRFIRWTEVFIIKSDDLPNGVHDPVDINKLSGNIAKATCRALVKLLDLLATAGLTKLGVRTTIHPDNVGYEAGSEGTKLPPIYMNSLDNELIQVLHKAAQNSQDTHTVLELIFYILDDIYHTTTETGLEL